MFLKQSSIPLFILRNIWLYNTFEIVLDSSFSSFIGNIEKDIKNKGNNVKGKIKLISLFIKQKAIVIIQKIVKKDKPNTPMKDVILIKFSLKIQRCA